MKRNFLTYIFLCILLLGASSCKDDLLYGGGIIGEGESVISGTVKFKPLTPALNGTTRTPGNAIKSIDSLCVLLYDVEGKLVKKYPLKRASTGTPNEGEYVLSEEDRTEHKTESIGDEDKNLPPAESETPHAEFKLTVPFGRYYIYAVANMDGLSGHEEAIQTKEGLKSISLTWNTENIAANNQMFGFFSEASTEADAPLLTINKGTTSLHAWIRRAASKITIAYDGSRLEEGIFVYLKSVTIRDIPSVCLLGAENKIERKEDLLEKGEFIDYSEEGVTEYNELWKARITKGRPYYYTGCDAALTEDEYREKGGKKAAHAEDLTSLFFYENMQGEGKDKQQDKEGDGVLDAPGFEGDEKYCLKDGKPYGTYIEVEGYYHSIHPERPGSGKIKYRFMLGKNITTDYNAERNHHYKLTLVFNRFANDADWHIEYKEQVPSIQAPVPYYISYLYNHSATMPVKVNVREGYRLKSFEAEIDSNAWAPYKPDPGLVYFEQMDPDATPGAHLNQWNGFLSLRKTKATVINELDNENYYRTHNRGNRTYYTDGKLNATDSNATDGTYTVKHDPDKNVYIFNLPIYTRAKQMAPRTGYTGNNPYVAYQRKAVIKFTAVMEKVDNPGETENVEGRSTIIQVRRVVNPKGVWREHNSTTPFHVVLKRLPKESSNSFETFTSEGAWKAYVVRGPKNFVTLNGRSDTIKGSTGTPIDFTIGFQGTILETESRCAIVRVEYHNYSCVHLIFVRQGKAPMALIEGGRKWHACNMRTKTEEGQCPLDEGSLFRFGNWDEPLDATNNDFNNFNSEGWKEYVIAGGINKKKWENIAAADYKGSFIPIKMSEKQVHVASYNDYEALWQADDIEQGYGVLYGNDATKTLSAIDEVYGYRYDKHTPADDRGAGYGMRGTFVYNTSEGEYGGRNLFFPIGVAGHGHRKHRDKPDSWESAVLRYSTGRTEPMPPNEAKDKPLLYDLYRRPGAIYWLESNKAKGDREGAEDVIAWDFNYFTLDFNHMSANNVFKKEQGEPNEPGAKNLKDHSDACFIRCVEEP